MTSQEGKKIKFSIFNKYTCNSFPWRFGNLRGGVMDIKSHKWFKEINWMDIFHRRAQPSFVPKCKGPGDANNFDFYDEEPIKVASIEKFAKEFEDF